MTTRLMPAVTAVMALALPIVGNALAQEFDPCAGLMGKAKGLCTQYSTAMECSSDSPLADPEACARVATTFEAVTGSPPPSDCLCDLSLERIRSGSERWATNVFLCTDERNFDPVTGNGDGSIRIRNQRYFKRDTETGRALPAQAAFLETGMYANLTSKRTSGTALQCAIIERGAFLENELIVKRSTNPEEANRLRYIYEACRGAIRTIAGSLSKMTGCGFSAP